MDQVSQQAERFKELLGGCLREGRFLEAKEIIDLKKGILN